MSNARSRLLKAVIALLASLATVLAGAVPAGAADGPGSPQGVRPGAAISAYGYYYGAIALARTGGAVGWSYDYSTRRAAFRRAMNECRASSDYPWSCERIAWVRNGCLAVAVRWDGDFIDYYGWGVARTKRAAYWRALDECGAGCVRRVYTCTRR